MCSSSPRGWGPELSVRFHHKGMMAFEGSEDTAQIAASSPSHTGKSQAGEHRESLLFHPASELREKTLFISFFLPSEIITQA